MGDRIPAIWFHKTKGVLVATALNGKVSYNKFIKPLPPSGIWTRIEVSQTLISSKYIFSITIGSEQVFIKSNTKPVDLSDVKVYAGSPWYSGQKGNLRKLKIEIKTPDCSTGETHLHFSVDVIKSAVGPYADQTAQIVPILSSGVRKEMLSISGQLLFSL